MSKEAEAKLDPVNIYLKLPINRDRLMEYLRKEYEVQKFTHAISDAIIIVVGEKSKDASGI